MALMIHIFKRTFNNITQLEEHTFGLVTISLLINIPTDIPILGSYNATQSTLDLELALMG